MTELRALTGVRGLAAWFVVLYHIRLSIGASAGVQAVLAKGYLAVDFFFLLSGFVIWLAYAERLRARGWAGVPHFLQRRIARIWPLHLVMLAFGVLIALALLATGRPLDPRFDFADLPAHILLVQNWRGYGALDWNDPAWSISCELFAYLLFPVFVMVVDWRRCPTIVVVAGIAALIATLAGVMATRGLTDLGQYIPQFGLLRCTTEFLSGTGIAALWIRYRTAPRAALAMAIAIAVLALAGFASGRVVEMASMPVAFAGLLLALAFAANAPANPFAGRALHYLGEISFATYLSHSLLWKAFKLAFVHHPGVVPPASIALYLAIVLAASILLYHGIERPAQRWINAFSPRFGRGPAVSPPVRPPALPPVRR